MFKNLRNNYYFGKAGKADYTVDDLPTTRWQLFMVTLRTRLGTLMRVNLLYALAFIPLLVVLVIYLNTASNILYASDRGDGTSEYSIYIAQQKAEGQETGVSDDTETVIPENVANELLRVNFLHMFLWIIPCIAITGPFTAGVSYLTRNWARDEHAFAWSDFKDALKDNWKQALPVSIITGLVPFLVYLGVDTYKGLAASYNNILFLIPEAIVIIAGIMWAISVTYMYPLMVTYELSFRNLMRNAFLLGVARLPFSVGIRLLLCVPVALAVGIMLLIPGIMPYVILVLMLWYALLGLMVSRFITSSYTNAVFDRFINPRIEGAKVNQGLYKDEEDDEEQPEQQENSATTEKRVEE